MLQSPSPSRKRLYGRPLTLADMLEWLRFVHRRQVVRGRHASVIDTLAQLGWIAWERQPVRPSLLDHARDKQGLIVPETIAVLTTNGRAALDQLVTLEAGDAWQDLANEPCGGTLPSP